MPPPIQPTAEAQAMRKREMKAQRKQANYKNLEDVLDDETIEANLLLSQQNYQKRRTKERSMVDMVELMIKWRHLLFGVYVK